MRNPKKKNKDDLPLKDFFVSKSETSQIKELRVSEDIDGWKTPASGAFSGNKGDVENKSFLVDAKLTEKKSFALSEKVLAKADKEATEYGKIPALAIEFTTFRFGVENKWAVIPYSIFVQMAKTPKDKE